MDGPLSVCIRSTVAVVEFLATALLWDYPASGIVGLSRSHRRGVTGWSSHGICHSNTGLQISLEASQLCEGFAGVLRAKLGYKAAAEFASLSRCPRRVKLKIDRKEQSLTRLADAARLKTTFPWLF